MLTFRYSRRRERSYTTDLEGFGYNPNGATITDEDRVEANFSAATDDNLALDVNAAVVTNLAVSPSTGEADSGQQVTLTLTMSEPVTVGLTGGIADAELELRRRRDLRQRSVQSLRWNFGVRLCCWRR